MGTFGEDKVYLTKGRKRLYSLEFSSVTIDAKMLYGASRDTRDQSAIRKKMAPCVAFWVYRPVGPKFTVLTSMGI